MTPYTADSDHERGMYFAAQGMAFVIVDVRGRGDSQGIFRPFVQEALDGFDVVEWVAQQPWCSGTVGMWGGSYGGYAQWAAAGEFPPHLATIVPVAAPYMGLDFPARNNIFSPYLVRWLALVRGRASHRKLFADDAFWSGLFRRWHESGQSFRDLEGMLGDNLPIFHEWLQHPQLDAYWDSCNPTASAYAQLDIPILTITGSYDDNQPGALEHYARHMAHASARAKAKHFLVIGPWDHAGTRTPQREFGGVRFGQASVIDLSQLHRDWYAWTMLNGRRPEFLRKRVAYYVMGAERWRYAETLEAITARHEVLYLDRGDRGSTLGPTPGGGSPGSYRFDPRVTDGPELEAEFRASGGSLVDQRLTVALGDRQFIYDSAPLEADMEVSGFFRLIAWISIDCPCTDIFVSVHDLAPDGGSIRLSTDAIRARYRSSLRVAELVQSTAPLRYDFGRFTFVSRLLPRGHRIRLIIAPLGRLIEATYAEKNCNAGGTVADESAALARPVTVKLHHDVNHTSALYVPVGRAEAD